MLDPNVYMRRRTLGSLVALCGLLASLTFAMAQADAREDCERQYKPETGQPGKDVVWVPTNDGLVERMLTMAKVATVRPRVRPRRGRRQDRDRGGEGSSAHARSASSTTPTWRSSGSAWRKAEGVADRARIMQGDIFETDFQRGDGRSRCICCRS